MKELFRNITKKVCELTPLSHSTTYHLDSHWALESRVCLSSLFVGTFLDFQKGTCQTLLGIRLDSVF